MPARWQARGRGCSGGGCARSAVNNIVVKEQYKQYTKQYLTSKTIKLIMQNNIKNNI
jgi:hypothetical protein